ncbi:MAG: hypothetical protein IPI90_17610 [Saprospiraceae bacterium]|nr:hypothetical protein [Candidatus Vicinibacter affinis]
MKKKVSYIRDNWGLLMFTTIFTTFPILICLGILIGYSLGVVPLDQWFNLLGISNNQFRISNVLIAFIMVSYVILFANQLIYLIESESKALYYRGCDRLFHKLNLTSILINILVLLSITLFIFKTSNYHEILHYNRYLSLGIFIAFSITDGLMWHQEYLARKALRDPIKKRLCSNNIAFCKKSILLINFPALLTLCFSLFIHHWVEANGFYLTYFNGMESMKIENFNLFIDGFETSFIFTSIIITQIMFAVLKIKWSYRRYQIINSLGNFPIVAKKNSKVFTAVH